MHKVLSMSVHYEWYTPPWIVARVKQLLGVIDLDPASNTVAQQIVQAHHWCGFDHPDPTMRDGLLVDWSQYRSVFLNPPYGGYIVPFAQKVANYATTLPMAVLVPARFSTRWWSLLTRGRHSLVLFSQPIRFFTTATKEANANAPFPVALLCYNCAIDRVAELFHDQLLYRPVV